MAIKVTYASRFGPSPWPPPPSQLFSALIASWGAQGEKSSHRAALEWIETLDPPAITAGAGHRRSWVSFVPLSAPNVTEFPQNATPSQVLSHFSSKGRNQKEWQEVSLESNEVWYHFPSGHFDQELAELCSHVSYLGNSHHLVQVRLDVEPPPATHYPNAKQGVMLGIIQKGRLQHCIERFYEVPARNQPTPRPARAPRICYGSDSATGKGLDRRTFRFRLVDRSFSLTHAAPLAEKIHRALVSIGGTNIPPVIHGHGCRGLTFNPVGFRDNLTSFDITFPDASYEDPRVCEIISRWIQNGLGEIPIECQGEVTGKSSRHWETKTPIIWHSHPRPRRMPAILERMCEQADLPIPKEVQLLPNPEVKRYRLPRHYRSGFFVSHAKFSWDEAVQGPLNLGAGRNFAMGALTPIEADDGEV